MDSNKSFEVLCAWCGRRTGWSNIDKSHGMCADCFRRLTGVPNMTEEELDLLPYGVIELDNTGNIICFNRTEQEAVKMRSENVCGRNFFTDVAPCTAVKEFQDSFIEFLKNDESTREFKFTFPFPRGLTKVRIAFIRKNTQSGFVIINRSGPQE